MTRRRETCADLPAGAQATRPAAWAAPNKNHGAAAEATLQDRLRKSPIAWTRRPAMHGLTQSMGGA